MTARNTRIRLAFAALLGAGAALAGDNLATLRDGAIAGEQDAPRFAKVENKDLKRRRAYPM